MHRAAQDKITFEGFCLPVLGWQGLGHSWQQLQYIATHRPTSIFEKLALDHLDYPQERGGVQELLWLLTVLSDTGGEYSTEPRHHIKHTGQKRHGDVQQLSLSNMVMWHVSFPYHKSKQGITGCSSVVLHHFLHLWFCLLCTETRRKTAQHHLWRDFSGSQLSSFTNLIPLH